MTITVRTDAQVASASVRVTAVSAATGVDPVSLFELYVPQGKANQVLTPGFASLTSWTVTGATSSSVATGRLVVGVPAGSTPATVTVKQIIAVAAAATFVVEFSAKASIATAVTVAFGSTNTVNVGTGWQRYKVFCTAPVNAATVLTFGVGAAAAYTLTLDNVTVLNAAASGAERVQPNRECGFRFTVSSAGVILAIRFYKPTGDPTTSRAVTLWDVATGTSLGRSTTVAETGQGWITVPLDPPVAVATGKTYSASYSVTGAAKWTTDAGSGYPVVSGPVTATGGAFQAGAGQYPSNPDSGWCYMADVVYQQAATTTAVTVGRNDPSGFSQLIRYGQSVVLTSGLLVIDDFEAPFDVPISYVVAQAVPVGADTGTSSVITLASNGQTWLKDPTSPGRNMVVPVVTAMTGLTRAAQAGTFTILGRANPLVVSTIRASMSASLACYTLTAAQEQQMAGILASGAVLLLAGPPSETGSAYIAVGDVGEELVGLVSEPSRLWVLPFQVVDRPSGLTSPNVRDRSWRAVRSKYATSGDLAATGKTWRELLEQGP